MTTKTPGTVRLGMLRPARLLIAAALVMGFLQITAGRSDAVQFCNTTPIIGSTGGGSPSSPYPSPIVVSGLTGTITDVNVTFLDFDTNPDPNPDHWAEDTDAMVEAPNDTTVILMSDAGGDNNISKGPVENADITFDDQAVNQLPADSLLTSGTFRPVDDDEDVDEARPVDIWNAPAPAPGGTALSAFNGIDPNGTWNLWVVDDTMLGANDIDGGWCIDIITTGGGGTTVPTTTTSTSTTVPTTTTSTSTSTTSTSTSTTSTSTSTTSTSTSTSTTSSTVPTTTTSTSSTVPTTTTSTSSTVPTTTTTSTTSSTVPQTTTTTSAPGTCDGLTPTITGTSGGDNITGTAGPDVIAGLGGNDTIQGLGGNDVICGGDGGDQIVGGAGNDRIFGQAGNDALFGEGGNDLLSGGPGFDRLSGGSDNDVLIGDADSDQCIGDAGTDTANTCETIVGVP